MTSPAPARRLLSTLVVAAATAALIVGLIYLPGVLGRLWPGAWGANPDHLGTAFTSLVNDGTTTELSSMIAYWQGFHVIKALIAAALTAALTILAVRTWRASAAHPGHAVRIAIGNGAIVLSTAAIVALVIAGANVQGSFAPLSSVLTLVPLAGSDPAAAEAAAQLLAQLQSGATSVPLELLVADFRDYHAVMAVVAGLCASALMVASLMLLVQRFRTPRAEKRLRRVIVLNAWVIPMFAMFFGVVTLANMSSAGDPASALTAFFSSGGEL